MALALMVWIISPWEKLVSSRVLITRSQRMRQKLKGLVRERIVGRTR
jgi:hypothetical protein